MLISTFLLVNNQQRLMSTIIYKLRYFVAKGKQ
nr:MAG TPA: hypothetical protein [Caudoviricetes sp.]